jgi:methyl-accepting chemotaxis protein
MSLRTRLLAAFGAMVLVMLVAGIVVFQQLRAVTYDVRHAYDDVLPALLVVDEFRDYVNEARRHSLREVLADESSRKAETDLRLASEKAAAQRIDTYAKQFALTAEGKKLAAEAKSRLDEFVASNAKLGQMALSGTEGLAECRSFVEGESATKLKAVLEAVRPLSQASLSEAERSKREATANARMAMWVLLALGAVAVGAGLALAVLLTRSITRPIQSAVEAVDRVAQGDLSVSLEHRGSDELSHLLRSVSAMQDALRRLVSHVRESADGISVASSEVATGNQDLSSRTEQTASSLQQTASSMEQLTGTVRQSADSARTANQLASSAAEVAQRGGSVVSQVVATMEDINNSSKKIADIISVIDGIAFQTNILALNAAVEAARAGEQGRGFAVVASEVRSLAGRSADAAKEIKTLIGASVEKVESGSKLVSDAGNTMQEIVTSVQRVTDIIAEISAAAAEQSQGIGQINAAVTQLDQMTQQNAALVEESAAAAESLKDQARRLGDVVSAFKLDSATQSLSRSSHASRSTSGTHSQNKSTGASASASQQSKSTLRKGKVNSASSAKATRAYKAADHSNLPTNSGGISTAPSPAKPSPPTAAAPAAAPEPARSSADANPDPGDWETF